jgi:hypothetical protein
LRAALYEYDKLVKNGLDQKTFEETRDFLSKYVNILTQTKDAELGYALDSNITAFRISIEYMKTAGEIDAGGRKPGDKNASRVKQNARRDDYERRRRLARRNRQ